MPRLLLTEEQLTALVQLLRGQDLSSKPVLRDVLRRLERLVERNDAARYPTPPAEDSQVDPSEKGANLNSQTRRGGRGHKARAADDSSSASASAWRCDPQDPSDSQPNDGATSTPTQSVFALDTAGAAARATIRHFEMRHHPQPEVPSRAQGDSDVDANQSERHHSMHGEVEIKTEEELGGYAMVETPGLRKSKRRRTRVD